METANIRTPDVHPTILYLVGVEKERVRHEMKMQRILAAFVCCVFGTSCLASMAIFFLQGFRLRGFRLETELMHWIGVATIGVIGTLASIVYRALFRNPNT